MIFDIWKPIRTTNRYVLKKGKKGIRKPQKKFYLCKGWGFLGVYLEDHGKRGEFQYKGQEGKVSGRGKKGEKGNPLISLRGKT